MPAAARVNDLHACPLGMGAMLHVGGPLQPPGARTVLIGGLPAARVSDVATCAGPAAGQAAVIVSGSATVLIEGLPAARMGDVTSHGGVIIGGDASVQVG